jgi:hypothetical protein
MIEAGDVVTLKGSSRRMTVELVYEATFKDDNGIYGPMDTVAKCLWFSDDPILHTAVVSVKALEKVNG